MQETNHGSCQDDVGDPEATRPHLEKALEVQQNMQTSVTQTP